MWDVGEGVVVLERTRSRYRCRTLCIYFFTIPSATMIRDAKTGLSEASAERSWGLIPLALREPFLSPYSQML